MPLGSLLKILLSALFFLAVVFVVALEFSLIQSDGDVNNGAGYEQAAKEAYKCVCSFGMSTISRPEARSSHGFRPCYDYPNYIKNT